MQKCSYIPTVVLVALVVVPVFAHAASEVALFPSLTLWVASAIGFLTSCAVLYSAQRIGGGALQKVYRYFGLGMLVVVLATVAVALPAWAAPDVVSQTHDLLFVIGFGTMAYGAQHLLRVVGLN